MYFDEISEHFRDILLNFEIICFQIFMDELQSSESADVNSRIIGQFGVGFYSTFMVGQTVDVYSQSYLADTTAHKWTSDG